MNQILLWICEGSIQHGAWLHLECRRRTRRAIHRLNQVTRGTANSLDLRIPGQNVRRHLINMLRKHRRGRHVTREAARRLRVGEDDPVAGGGVRPQEDLGALVRYRGVAQEPGVVGGELGLADPAPPGQHLVRRGCAEPAEGLVEGVGEGAPSEVFGGFGDQSHPDRPVHRVSAGVEVVPLGEVARRCGVVGPSAEGVAVRGRAVAVFVARAQQPHPSRGPRESRAHRVYVSYAPIALREPQGQRGFGRSSSHHRGESTPSFALSQVSASGAAVTHVRT